MLHNQQDKHSSSTFDTIAYVWRVPRFLLSALLTGSIALAVLRTLGVRLVDMLSNHSAANTHVISIAIVLITAALTAKIVAAKITKYQIKHTALAAVLAGLVGLSLPFILGQLFYTVYSHVPLEQMLAIFFERVLNAELFTRFLQSLHPMNVYLHLITSGLDYAYPALVEYACILLYIGPAIKAANTLQKKDNSSPEQNASSTRERILTSARAQKKHSPSAKKADAKTQKPPEKITSAIQ